MKLSILLGAALLFATTSVAQEVIGRKGTVVVVDSSKWRLSGSNIYNKNSGNTGIGITAPAYKLDIAAPSNPVRIQGLLTGQSSDSVLTVLNGVIRRVPATDTASISNRINSKVGYSDTAGMLQNYLTGTGGGLTKTGKNLSLGGALSAPTTLTLSGQPLTFATGGAALSITGLTSGATSDSLLTINASTGRVNRLPVSAIANSIYTNDGTLSGPRSITMGSNTLAFDTTTLFINGATNQIGVGTVTPAASAQVDISSTNGGLLIPRMSRIERLAISNPANGLIVYDLGTNGLWIYKGNVWLPLISGAPAVNPNNNGSPYTGNYTLQPSDAGSILEFNSATAVFVTIPAGLPAGFQCSITQLGAGRITFTATVSANLKSSYGTFTTATQFSKAGVEITSTGIIIISGDLQ